MGHLKRDQILAIDDRLSAEMDIPEWATQDNPKGTIGIRAQSGYLRRRAYEGAEETRGYGEEKRFVVNQAKMQALTVILNSDCGFSEEDMDRVLQEKNSNIIERIYAAILMLGVGIKPGEAQAEPAKPTVPADSGPLPVVKPETAPAPEVPKTEEGFSKPPTGG